MASKDCSAKPKYLYGKVIDITGQRFGMWEVLKFVRVDEYKFSLWECRCDCGKVSITRANDLKRGKSLNCGCERLRRKIEWSTKHGHASRLNRLHEYQVWRWMKARCLNPKDCNFKHYGGRGITICPEWINNFETFLKDMGERPSPNHSIDRINVNGNYEPSNCRWATIHEQANNRRSNRIFTLNGKSQTLTQWAIESKSSPSAIKNRLNRGWCNVCALTLPINENGAKNSCPHRVKPV
jgi:hypothetical protein